jgi:hypothetical protein
MLKPVQCKDCRFLNRDKVYRDEGNCKKDGRYTKDYRVCNLLNTDQLRRDAKRRSDNSD